MALVELARRLAHHAVDHPAALDRRAGIDRLGPALDVLVVLHLQELARIVEQTLGQRPVPGPDRHVGDGVFGPGDELVVGQLAIEHVELALHFHGVAIDRVFVLHRRIGIEMPEAAAQERRRAHLPLQPGQALGPRGRAGGQEGAELLGQIHEDRAGFEHPDRLRSAAVVERRNLGVRVDLDEAAGELVALADLDQPGVVFGAAVAGSQELFQHDRHLDAVRRRQGIELQRMLADRQLLVMGRAGDGTVDAGELAAAFLVPGPDGGRRVVGIVGHRHLHFRILRVKGDRVRWLAANVGRADLPLSEKPRRIPGTGPCALQLTIGAWPRGSSRRRRLRRQRSVTSGQTAATSADRHEGLRDGAVRRRKGPGSLLPGPCP